MTIPQEKLRVIEKTLSDLLVEVGNSHAMASLLLDFAARAAAGVLCVKTAGHSNQGRTEMFDDTVRFFSELLRDAFEWLGADEDGQLQGTPTERITYREATAMLTALAERNRRAS